MKKRVQKIFNPQNEFFLLTQSAKRITHISLSSLVMPVVFLIVSVMLTYLIIAPLYFGDPKTASGTAHQAFGLFTLFGMIIICVFLWVKLFEGRPFYTIGFTKSNAVRKYLKGFAVGSGLNIFLITSMWLMGSISIDNNTNEFTGAAAIGGVLVFFFAYLIQGASEEILIRGWMFQVIGARYTPWLGVLITSIVFSAMHLGNEGVNFFAAINIFLIAILLSLFVMKDKSLWGACGFHSAWNWTLGNLFGLSVSGSGQKPTIINLNTFGNELISGGGFGPEGSIILTILLILIVLFIGRELAANGSTDPEIDSEINLNDNSRIMQNNYP